MTTPEFNWKLDRVFANAMISTIMIPFVYSAFVGYMTPTVKTVWVFLSVPVTYLLFLAGSAVQNFYCSRRHIERPVYDPMARSQKFVRIGSTIPAMLCAIAVGVVFYLIASSIRQAAYLLLEEGVKPEEQGNLFELFAALCGFLPFYTGAPLWFIPDELLLARGTAVYYVLPFPVIVVMTMYMGIPLYASAIFIAPYFVLMYVRAMTEKSYMHKQLLLEREEADKAHHSRFDY